MHTTLDKGIKKLISFVADIEQNENILISTARIKEGYSPEHLEEIEQGLEVKFDNPIRNFFLEVGEISILWTVNKAKFSGSIPEEDMNHLAGSIQILSPFDMIMGKTGTKWKDVLWFNDMPPELKNEIRSFIPFDFPSSEIVAGFLNHQNIISEEVIFYYSNNGIEKSGINLAAYLNYLIVSKGYFYWQDFILEKSSPEFDRFIRYMPILFEDFEPSVFINTYLHPCAP